MKKRNLNPTTMIIFIFSFVGIIFLAVGVGFCVNGVNSKINGEEIKATITDIDTYKTTENAIRHRVYVEYEYDGEFYSDMALNNYNSSMRTGKEIEIIIDPDNPEVILDSGFSFMFTAIFGGIGLIFAVISGICSVKSFKRKALIKHLIDEGYYIEAKIGSVDCGNVRVNNRPTFIVRCVYDNPDDGRIYSFKSELLMYDPTPMIDFESGTIKVYVDRNDFTKNYVDVSELQDRYIEC